MTNHNGDPLSDLINPQYSPKLITYLKWHGEMSYRRMETTSKDAEWKQGQDNTGDTQDGIQMLNLDNRSLEAISILLFDCA